MNQCVGLAVTQRSILISVVTAGILGLAACSDDANLGKKGAETGGDGGSAATTGGSASSFTGGASSGGGKSTGGSSPNTGGIVETGGTGGTGTGGTSNPPLGGAAGASTRGGAAGEGEGAGAGAGGVGGASAGAAGSGGSDSRDGVILTALLDDASGRVNAEWYNGTDTTVFLRGCSTTDGWYREAGVWKQYGAFAACAVEGLAIELAAGATHLDLAGGVPPDRGDNVWRLVGPYGTGCTSGVKFSQANCTELHEATSSNEVGTQ